MFECRIPPRFVSLFLDQCRVAESASGCVASFVRRQAIFPLVLFFQFQIGAQLPLQVRISPPELPPPHVSSPRRLATSRAPQLRPSVSTAILQPQVASGPCPSAGNT